MQDMVVELVTQYGMAGAVVAVCLISLLLFSANRISKSNNKVTSSVDSLSESIIEQNGKLMSAISDSNRHLQCQFAEILKKTMNNERQQNKDEHFDGMCARINVSDEIKDIIKEINDKCHAARTILFEFHNSNENFNGVPFVKYDATSVWLARDTRGPFTPVKDFQFTILYPVIKELYENKCNIVHYDSHWVSDKLYDLSAVLYVQYMEIGVTDVIYTGCYSKNNRLVGVIAVEFNDKHPYINTNISKDEIICASEQISALLRLK